MNATADKDNGQDLPPPVSSSRASETLVEKRGLMSRLPSESWRSYVMADVDSELSTWPLAAYCFMTGFMSVSSSVFLN